MSERPTQLVATNSAAATAAGRGCVAIQAAPGVGDMLAADLSIGLGVRALLLSFCFANATTVTVRKKVSGGSFVDMTLFEGGSTTAGALYSSVVVPVEPGDSINFRLGTGNDGAATRMFKAEASATH